MPKVVKQSTERIFLTGQIESIRQKLRIRRKPKNVGKYKQDEIDKLEEELEDLLEQREKFDKGKPIRKKGSHNNRGPREDVKIAQELLYSKHVQDLLWNEPDEEKRSRILHDARVGKLK